MYVKGDVPFRSSVSLSILHKERQYKDSREIYVNVLFRLPDKVPLYGPSIEKSLRGEAAASSTDTTAGASHDFDGVVRGFSRPYFVHQFAGISETVGNGHLQFESVNVNGSFFQVADTSNVVEINIVKGFARVYFISGA